ncbi:receptor expression-enhancing protein 3 [Cricetulus griseus]|nr:receptor expression-enhancing protein 3 [Cricetulus griseus]
MAAHESTDTLSIITYSPMGSWPCGCDTLVFGMLYPAYYSYKAVKTKNVKEYVRWMMYWIVFALYTVIETVADQTLVWFPLYYELKIAFVIWLLSPYTKGASLIYRKFLHPLLSSKEREIDDYIVQAKEKGYETMVNFGRQGLNLAAAAAVTAAVKSQGAITERLRSFSMHDLTTIQGDEPVGQRPYQTLPEAKRKSKQASEPAAYGIPLRDGNEQTDEEAEGPFSDDEMVTHKGLRRTQSMKSVKTIKGRKEVRYGSLKYKVKKRPQMYGAKPPQRHVVPGKYPAVLPAHQYTLVLKPPLNVLEQIVRQVPSPAKPFLQSPCF